MTVSTATYTVIPMADSCPGPAKSNTVTVNPLPIPAISDGVICVNQATNVPFQTYLLDSQLRNATFNFVWYLNDLLIPENNSTYVAAQSGTYAVKATNSITGWVSLLTSAIVIDSFPRLTLDTIQTAAFSENASIIVTSIGGNGNYLYSIGNRSLQQSNI